MESSPRKPWQENLSEEVVEKAESTYEEMISQTQSKGLPNGLELLKTRLELPNHPFNFLQALIFNIMRQKRRWSRKTEARMGRLWETSCRLFWSFRKSSTRLKSTKLNSIISACFVVCLDRSWGA